MFAVQAWLGSSPRTFTKSSWILHFGKISPGEVRTCSFPDLVTDSKAYLVSSRPVRNVVSNTDAKVVLWPLHMHT